MTTEYVEGDEDIFLVVQPRKDGNVSVAIHLVSNNEKLYGFILPAEVARKTAEKLTMSSIMAEEYKNYGEDMR